MFKFQCPLDGGKIIESDNLKICNICNKVFPLVDIDNKKITDFRCLEVPTVVTLNFKIPQFPLKTGQIDKMGVATDSDFRCLSREQIRKMYGSKLQKEVLYYIDKLLNNVGEDAVILDLGCGKGGNKKYLNSIGFNNVVSVDYISAGADYLVDVHRLPFASGSFDMILTTATLEHFYNPYIAFMEMNRVLKEKSMLIASGSFWESWHGNSCFHFTPGGLELLCRASDFTLLDLWSGWGFIPSVSSHALGLRRIKRITYLFQKFFDKIVLLKSGRNSMKKHKYKTSGSFGLYAETNK